jgi:hypothetical protein
MDMRKRFSAVVLAGALTLASATAPAFADDDRRPPPAATLVTCTVTVQPGGQVIATVRVSAQAAALLNGRTITVNGRTFTVSCR